MVVFVITNKGAYWRAFHLARQLVRDGYRVTLMAMSPTNRFHIDSYQEEGVDIIAMPDLLWGSLRSGWDPWECIRRIAWVADKKFDLVHLFDTRPTALAPALYLQSRRSVPLVMDWEDWLGSGGSVEQRPNSLVRSVLRPVETFFEEHFRLRADAATVICTTLRDKAIALGVPPENILLLRDGADVAGLIPLNRDVCRRELCLPEDAIIIGFVGTIFYKDAQLMARAFDLLHDNLPEARLLLIGYVNYRVEELTHASQAVIRTGTINHTDLNRYLAACDVCWLPLCNSGANCGRWPMKLNDYMCVARPTIATAVGDVTDVMRQYEIGVLSQDSPDDLSFQTQTLLSDPSRCDYLGKNARHVAEEVFDWKFRTKELVALYEKLSLPNGTRFRYK